MLVSPFSQATHTHKSSKKKMAIIMGNYYRDEDGDGRMCCCSVCESSQIVYFEGNYYDPQCRNVRNIHCMDCICCYCVCKQTRKRRELVGPYDENRPIVPHWDTACRFTCAICIAHKSDTDRGFSRIIVQNTSTTDYLGQLAEAEQQILAEDNRLTRIIVQELSSILGGVAIVPPSVEQALYSFLCADKYSIDPCRVCIRVHGEEGVLSADETRRTARVLAGNTQAEDARLLSEEDRRELLNLAIRHD